MLYPHVLVIDETRIFASWSRRNSDTRARLLPCYKDQGCVMCDARNNENTTNLSHTMKSFSFLQEPLSLQPAPWNMRFSVLLWVMRELSPFNKNYWNVQYLTHGALRLPEV